MTIIRKTKAIIFDNNDKYKSNSDNYYYLDQQEQSYSNNYGYEDNKKISYDNNYDNDNNK